MTPEEIQSHIDSLQLKLDALKAQTAESTAPLPPLKHGDVWRRADGELVALWKHPRDGSFRGGYSGDCVVILYGRDYGPTGDEGPDYALVERIASLECLVELWEDYGKDADQ